MQFIKEWVLVSLACQGHHHPLIGQLHRAKKLLEGAHLTERCSSLWMNIQAYYRVHEVQDRLQLLRCIMLRKETASPKLRASAAEARALTPFALELANGVLDDANTFHAAMKSAADHLLQCCKSL